MTSAIVLGCLAVTLPALAQETSPIVVRELVEPASGARVRVYRAPVGEGVFDVARHDVRVSKRVARDGSWTTVQAGGERVTLFVSPRRVVLEGLGAPLEVTRGHEASAADLRARVAGSRSVRQAVALLSEVRLPEASPMHHAIQATRMLLQTAAGEKTGPRTTASLTDLLRRQTLTTRTQMGPGDCWATYAVEAITTWIEYEQCVDGEQWWDVFGMLSCLAIYELRAIGAFSWWLSCTGFGNWVG